MPEISERVFYTDARQYTEQMAGVLIGIAETGVAFASVTGSITEALAALEGHGCLVIGWEDDVPFDIAVTEYGQRIAANLERQGIAPIDMTTLFRDE